MRRHVLGWLGALDPIPHHLDIEAATTFRAEDFPSLEKPEMLVLAPDPRVGVTRPELERIEEFLDLNR